VTLGFGAAPTGPAAAYPSSLCNFIGALLIEGAKKCSSAAEARGSALIVAEGRVKRHHLRGDTEESQRERKSAEDEASLAGMRNPASVCKVWPDLVSTMLPVRKALLAWHGSHPEFHGLGGVCGATPSRDPPSEQAVAELRAQVAKAVGLTAAQGEEHHPASGWRHRLVSATQALCHDPDVPLGQWLREGAPMGLARPVERGGLFPPTDVLPELSLDELAALETMRGNHPSFSMLHGNEIAPGIALLNEQLNKGFGVLFSSRAAAEAHLGGIVHPAPLGNISKEKPDGSMKHRLIQDLKRN
jgi:hypothetical protein